MHVELVFLSSRVQNSISRERSRSHLYFFPSFLQAALYKILFPRIFMKKARDSPISFRNDFCVNSFWVHDVKG